MAVFSFDVTVSSHALLRQGRTEVRVPFSDDTFHRVFVEADTQHEAELVAVEMAQLVASRYNPDVMVTGCYPRF